MGNRIRGYNTNSIIVGQDITNGENAIDASSSIIIGNQIVNYREKSIALGTNINSSSNMSIVMGNNIGDRNAGTLTNSIIMGNDIKSYGNNSIFLGSNGLDFNARDNIIFLGNLDTEKLYCKVTTISSPSDARDKTDIVPIPAGIDFIDRLNPVQFTWNMRNGGKKGKDEFGFIAQELIQVQEETGITVPNLVCEENPAQLMASYSTLIPIMVKSIQELKTELDVSRKYIEQLQKEVALLRR